jgi:DNA-binding transcriptional MerR regulator
MSMRISDLSASSGVSLPTLKFYLREGLLQPGESTGRNQAAYDERHLRRLRLVRALTEVGNLSLKEVKAVLDAADDPTLPIHELLGVAQYALEPPSPSAIEASAAATVDAAIEMLGWRVSDDAPARRSIAHAVEVLRSLGWSVDPADLVRYAKAVDRLAESEVAISDGAIDRERLVERMVVGSVVFEAILTAFRRLAQEHHSAARRRSVAER